MSSYRMCSFTITVGDGINYFYFEGTTYLCWNVINLPILVHSFIFAWLTSFIYTIRTVICFLFFSTGMGAISRRETAGSG